MYGVCLRYMKSTQDAEDMLQEAMFIVFKDLHTYKEEGSLEGWIRRIVVNTNLQFIRKKRMKYDWNTDVSEISQEDNSYLDVFRKFENEDLLNLINLIPEGCQLIFNLFVIEEFTHKEIAEKLSISVGTSKSQLSKARRILKEILSKEKEKGAYEQL